MKRWDGLADRFMEVYASRGLAGGTVQAMRREWDLWGCWLKARRPRPHLEDVTPEMITRYIGIRGKFRAKHTQYGIMSRMRRIGDFLVAERVWQENPLQWMKGPRIDRRHRLPRRINESTLAAIWEEAAQSRETFHRHLWVAALAVLYGGGLRRGEIVRLDVANWDSRAGTLLVREEKTRRERRIVLPDLCQRCIEAYLPRRQNVLSEKSCSFETALFVNRRGKRLSSGALSGGIQRISERAGQRVTLHQFRHTCASQLLSAGVRLPHVQQVLGHRSIETTMRYLDVADRELHEAIKRHPINHLNSIMRSLADQPKEGHR